MTTDGSDAETLSNRLDAAGIEQNSGETSDYLDLDSPHNLNAIAIGLGLEKIAYEPVIEIISPGRKQPPGVLVDLVDGLIRNDLDWLMGSDVEPWLVASIRDVLGIEPTLEIVEGNEERRSTTLKSR